MLRRFVKIMPDRSYGGDVYTERNPDPVVYQDATDRTDDPQLGKVYDPVNDVWREPARPYTVEIETLRWNGRAWTEETREFTEGEEARIRATIRRPDNAVATEIDGRFRIPLFRGIQGAPAADGTESVQPLPEIAMLIPLQFRHGVATFDCVFASPGWLVAVPGQTSNWLTAPVVRAVLTRALEEDTAGGR